MDILYINVSKILFKENVSTIYIYICNANRYIVAAPYNLITSQQVLMERAMLVNFSGMISADNISFYVNY